MEANSLQHHTILWADDDVDDLLLIREVITAVNETHQLLEAYNGRQVIDYLNAVEPSKLPCLVVLDINMPLLNGKETLAIIKSEERYSDMTIAVFTTSFNETDKRFCEGYGVRMFIKPRTFGELYKTINEIIGLCKTSDRRKLRLN
jgi:CheY-like chemotaxis protein